MKVNFKSYFSIMLPFLIQLIKCDSSPTNSTTSLDPTTLYLQEIQNAVNNYTCYSDSNCSNNGQCSSVTHSCHCNPGFSTYLTQEQIDSKTFTVCNYEQKSQLTAFLLSLFVGFTGADHFYLHNYDKGITKLCFSLVCCLGNIFIFIVYKCCPEDKQYLIGFVGLYEGIYLGCGFFFMCLWMLYDLINIGTLVYTDGYGIPMKPW